LYDLASDTAGVDIKIDIDLPRRYSAWVGGSMLSSLSTFESMTIKATEYEDNAEAHQDAVFKKLIF
jgi:actin-related protein